MSPRRPFALALLLAGSLMAGQVEREVKLPLGWGPTTVRGFIGGESHDRYSVALAAGQGITISISSRHNRAHFTVSDSGEIGGLVSTDFGAFSQDQQSWTGVTSKPTVIYIFVVAHPDAHYKLTVGVKP